MKKIITLLLTLTMIISSTVIIYGDTKILMQKTKTDGKLTSTLTIHDLDGAIFGRYDVEVENMPSNDSVVKYAIESQEVGKGNGTVTNIYDGAGSLGFTLVVQTLQHTLHNIRVLQ